MSENTKINPDIRLNPDYFAEKTHPPETTPANAKQGKPRIQDARSTDTPCTPSELEALSNQARNESMLFFSCLHASYMDIVAHISMLRPAR